LRRKEGRSGAIERYILCLNYHVHADWPNTDIYQLILPHLTLLPECY
jgi:hypothetical protein